MRARGDNCSVMPWVMSCKEQMGSDDNDRDTAPLGTATLEDESCTGVDIRPRSCDREGKFSCENRWRT